jgi:D-amino peptidase
MAEMSAWLHGVELAEDRSRTVSLTGDDPLVLFRTFVTMVILTRSLVE